MTIGVRCCVASLFAALLSLSAAVSSAPAHAAGFKAFGQRPPIVRVAPATAWVQAARPPRSFNV
jgi:hypothetical protein